MTLPNLAVGSASLRLYAFRTPPGLILREVEIESGPAASLDGEIRLQNPADFRATVDEEELTRFVAGHAGEALSELLVRARGGVLLVTGVKPMAFLKIKVNATLGLVIEDEKRLMVIVREAQAMGAGVSNLVETQIEKINPVLDVADLPVDVRFTKIEITEGLVTVFGTLQPPAKVP